MRKSTPLFALLFVLSLTTNLYASPVDTDELSVAEFNQTALTFAAKDQWQGFSENLTVALKSDHDGLKVAAMGMVIRFGNKVDVQNAVFDVMRIYQDHPNEKMRRMALVALGQMESGWAIGFLERAQHFEDSPVLKQTMQAVINDYHATHTG